MNTWGNEKSDDTDQIKPDKWNEYFKNLLNKPAEVDPNNHQKEHVTCTLNTPTFNPILGGLITQKELRDALTKLQINKAPGSAKHLEKLLKEFYSR